MSETLEEKCPLVSVMSWVPWGQPVLCQDRVNKNNLYISWHTTASKRGSHYHPSTLTGSQSLSHQAAS